MGEGRRKDRLAEADASARLQSVTPQMGGGADLLVVEPKPAHEQGLREVVRHRGGVHLRSDDTLDGEAAGPCVGFSDSFSRDCLETLDIPKPEALRTGERG